MPNIDTQRFFCEYCAQEYNDSEISPTYAPEPTDVTEEEEVEQPVSYEEKQYRCPDCQRKLVNLKS